MGIRIFGARRFLQPGVSNPPPPPPPPSLLPPTGLTVNITVQPSIAVTWSAAAGADGYNIYRNNGGGAFTKLNASLIVGLAFDEHATPPTGYLCYEITSVAGSVESGASGTVCVTYPPVQAAAPAGITGPVTAHDTPNLPLWRLGMKHVTMAFHPPSGRIYYTCGDYHGFSYLDGQHADQSYSQETGSFDIAQMLAGTTSFRLEYPYDGFGGSTIQPKHPDFVGFTWDSLRNIFWMIPGTSVNNKDTNSPGETIPGVDDPNFKYGVYTFDPSVPMTQATPRWHRVLPPNPSDQGGGFSSQDPAIYGPFIGDTWFNIYDAVQDRFICSRYNGGGGACVVYFYPSTLTWNVFHNDIGDANYHVSKEYMAFDEARRTFYQIDNQGIPAGNPRVLSFNIDTLVTEDLGLPPGARNFPLENYSMILYNKNHNLLEWQEFIGVGLCIYKADVRERPLKWKAVASGFNARAAVFDPLNDVSFWAGGGDADFNQNSVFTLKAAELFPAVGNVGILPSANTMRSVMYGTPCVGSGDGAGLNYFDSWCSGVFCKDLGNSGSMVFCNGGDKDYWGTEVYAFDIAQGYWYRLNERATGLNGVVTTGGDPNFDETWGEHISTLDASRQPAGPHSYNQMLCLPPALGGGTKGSFMFGTRSVCYQFRGYFHPHAFDLSTKVWRRASTTPAIFNDGSGKDMGFAASSPSWAFDPTRNLYWGMISGTGPIANDYIWWMTFSGGMATAHRQGLAAEYISPDRYPTTLVWPEGDMLLVAGMKGGSFTLDALSLTALDQYRPVTLTGNPIAAANGPGFAYLNGKLYVRCAEGNRQTMYQITPVIGSLTWNVVAITMGGVTVDPKDTPSGMWHRLMANDIENRLEWCDNVNGPVYSFRPS